MVKVIADDFIKEEFLSTVTPLYQELIALTRKEQGCLEYTLFIDESDNTHLVFVETWTDSAALKAHMASEHFTRLIPQIAQYQAKKGQILVLNPF